jgi:hypothetical protein
LTSIQFETAFLFPKQWMMKALDEFRKANTQFALVVDEHGAPAASHFEASCRRWSAVPSEEEEEPAVIQRRRHLADCGMFTVEDFGQRFPAIPFSKKR